MRTECVHCGAAIEFDPDDRGIESTCPACGGAVMLVEGLHRPKPPETPAAQTKSQFGLGVAVGMVLGMAVLAVARLPWQQPTPQPVQSLRVSDSLAICKEAYFGDRTPRLAIGVVTNRSALPALDLAIGFLQYDGFDHVVGETADRLSLLPGHEKWEFRCTIRPDCVRLKLAVLTAAN